MENQRVRLTKMMLKSALMELLKEKPIGKIAIRELCAKAQINHTTFYKYYGSQYELLAEIESGYFEELERRLTEDNTEKRDGLTAALRFLEDEKDGWRVLINTVHDEEFADRLFHLPVIRRLLDKNLGTEVDDSLRDYIHLYICHGGYAIIRQWLNAKGGESPEEIAALILTLSKNAIL